MNPFPLKSFSKKQLIDAGMALGLIFVIVGVLRDNMVYYYLTGGTLLVTMITPVLIYPFALIWYNLSEILGSMVSKIILSVIYIVLVVPVGTLRKLAGKDSMQLKKFKKSNDSVLISRNKSYTFEDIVKPF